MATSLSPGIHIKLTGKNWLHKVVSWPPDLVLCCSTHTNNRFKKKKSLTVYFLPPFPHPVQNFPEGAVFCQQTAFTTLTAPTVITGHGDHFSACVLRLNKHLSLWLSCIFSVSTRSNCTRWMLCQTSTGAECLPGEWCGNPSFLLPKCLCKAPSLETL